MSILNQIGHTPLIQLKRVVDSQDVEIFVKCEFMNPGGSIKDRMALTMIEAAEKSGKLREGATIVDQSTGNTGPALAFVGAVKGYKVRLFLPTQLSSAYNPADRIRIAKLYGCDVAPVDLEDHLEYIDQLDAVEKAAAFVAGDVDAWVTSVGTGGTLLGVAETLRSANPDLKVTGVLPTDDRRIDWVRSRAVHKFLEKFGVPGFRFLIEDILEQNIIDSQVIVENENAKNMADRVCREEGLFCGISSGANVFAAIQVAKKMEKGSRVVTVLVDRRDRYFAEYPHEHYVV